MAITPKGTRAYYSINGGGAYTEFPLPLTSMEPTGGTTTDVNRAHLNNAGLDTTSPGNRQPGMVVFNFEWNPRLAAAMTMLQLIAGWWEAQTEDLLIRVDVPKPTGASVAPRFLYQGYVNQEPVPSVPEDDRQVVSLNFKLVADPVRTSHS